MLNELTPTQVAGLVALIGAIGTAIGVVLMKVAEFYSKYRAEKRQDALATANIDLLEDKQLDDALKYHIKKQDKQITELQAEARSLQGQLMHCLEEHTREQTRGGFLQEQLDEMRKRIDGYRNELQKFREGTI
jgi:uncharacterized protein HemX